MYKTKLENPEYMILVDEFKAIKSVKNKIAWLETNREILEKNWGTKVDSLIKEMSKNI